MRQRRAQGPAGDRAVTYRLILSYRGGAYAGWQRQGNALAVQQVVEEALGALIGAMARAEHLPGGAVGRPAVAYTAPGREPSPALPVVGASRTDAGVHARGQAVHLELPAAFSDRALDRALVHGTNHHLPEDVRVLGADRMPAGFHARKHAAGKEYRYRLVRGRVLSPLDAPTAVGVPEDLDLAALAEATARLPGRHDFTAFALAGGAHTQPVRRLFEASWDEAGPELTFRVVGEGFLRGMVRGLVGTLLQVATGRRTPEGFGELLTGRPRSEAGPTAPPQGLVLERVIYRPPWTPLGEAPGPALEEAGSRGPEGAPGGPEAGPETGCRTITGS